MLTSYASRTTGIVGSCAVLIYALLAGCAPNRSELAIAVEGMATDPASGIATETYGVLDKRQAKLVRALQASPNEFEHVFSSGDYYVRSNLLHAAAEVGQHDVFVVVAIKEFNDGEAWLPALVTLNSLAPALGARFNLPTSEEIGALYGNVERPDVQISTDVASKLVWENERQSFVFR